MHKRPGGVPPGRLRSKFLFELLLGIHALRRRGVFHGGAAENCVAATFLTNVLQFVMRSFAGANRHDAALTTRAQMHLSRSHRGDVSLFRCHFFNDDRFALGTGHGDGVARLERLDLLGSGDGIEHHQVFPAFHGFHFLGSDGAGQRNQGSDCHNHGGECQVFAD